MTATEDCFALGVLPGQSIIGTCSCCGGPVQVPTLWGGIIPPTPTCGHCGAMKADKYGQVIPMTPAWKP